MKSGMTRQWVLWPTIEGRLFGFVLLGGLLVVASGCAAVMRADDAATIGTYGARMPAASSPGRVIYLTLSADRRVVMRADYLNDQPVVEASGTWEPGPKATVVVTLTGRADRTYEKPPVLTFAREEDALIAVGYDRRMWGDAGLTLHRQPEMTGREWQLVEVRPLSDTVFTLTDAANFTLTFAEGGMVAVRADCNRGTGRYLLAGKSLSLERMALTHAMCSPQSFSDQFVRALDQVRSVLLTEGTLYLFIPRTGTSLKFISEGGSAKEEATLDRKPNP